MLNFVIEDDDESRRVKVESLLELFRWHNLPHWVYKISELTQHAYYLITEGDTSIWHPDEKRFSLDGLSPAMLTAIQQERVWVLFEITSNAFPITRNGTLAAIEQEFAQRNISMSQLVIVTCNVMEKDDYAEARPLGLVRIFELGSFVEYTARNLRLASQAFPKRVLLDTLNEAHRPRKFVYLNGSNHGYRCALVIKLMSLGITDQGLFSFSNNTVPNKMMPDEYVGMLHGSVDKWWPDDPDLELLHATADRLATMGPIRVDDMKWEEGMDALYLTSANYMSSYFSIVSETLFEDEYPDHPRMFITEKIIRPVAQYQPFVVLGKAGSLDAAKQRGVESFHPHIDESYDQEPDDHKRMEMVVAEIQRLCDMSLDELHKWYHGPLKDIVIRNYDRFMDGSTSPVHDVAAGLRTVLGPSPLNLWFEYITPTVPIPNGIVPAKSDTSYTIGVDADGGINHPWSAPLEWGLPEIYFVAPGFELFPIVRPICNWQDGERGFCWITVQGGMAGLAPHGMTYLSQLSDLMLERIRAGDIKLVLDCSIEGNPLSNSNFNGFLGILGSNGIPFKHVIVITGNLKDTNAAYQRWCQETNFLNTGLTFIPFCIYESAMQTWVQFLPSAVQDIRPHKFLCLNRVPYGHRSAMVLALMDMGELTTNLISYPNRYVVDARPVTEYMLNDAIDKFWPDANDSEALKKLVPTLLEHDSLHVDTLELTGDLSMSAPPAQYEASYFSIVTETLFDDVSLFLTEKVWKPIFSLHPFLIVGSVGTMRHLQLMGYQTFHPYIDESYDTLSDNVARFHAIVSEIKRLCKMTPEDLHAWYWSLMPILEHNQRWFLERRTEDFKRFINTMRQHG